MGVVGGGGGLWGMGEIVLFCIGFFFFFVKKVLLGKMSNVYKNRTLMLRQLSIHGCIGFFN